MQVRLEYLQQTYQRARVRKLQAVGLL